MLPVHNETVIAMTIAILIRMTRPPESGEMWLPRNECRAGRLTTHRLVVGSLKNLRYQLPVFEGFRAHDPREGVVEDVVVLSIVVSPFQFVDVAIHVLDAHLVERAGERTLEQRPHALDAVRVNVAHDPFLFGVVHGFMAGVAVLDADIRPQLISVYGLGIVLHVAPDEVVERVFPDVGDALDSHLAAALDGPGDPLLVALVAVALALRLAAYERFIHFHHAQKRRAGKRLVSHGLAYAVAQIPRRAVGDAQGALHLVGGDALLGFAHEVDRQKPLAKRQVGIVHDRATRHGKLVFAALAFPAILVLQFEHVHIAAPRAAHTGGPANVAQHRAAFFVIAEPVYQGNEVHHGSKASG